MLEGSVTALVSWEGFGDKITAQESQVWPHQLLLVPTPRGFPGIVGEILKEKVSETIESKASKAEQNITLIIIIIKIIKIGMIIIIIMKTSNDMVKP